MHEMREEAHGCTFKEIIDATPEALKWDPESRQKRLYKELAVMICGSEDGAPDLLGVGLHLLLNAIAVSPAKRVEIDRAPRPTVDDEEAMAAVAHKPQRAAACEHGGGEGTGVVVVSSS